MTGFWDIIIIGAGPAGMSAALAAAASGASVMVLDRQTEPGGLIYKNAGTASETACKLMGADYATGRDLVRRFQASGVEFMDEAVLWHIKQGEVYVGRKGHSSLLRARQILIASGAMERPVPLPGWDLPGVMGAGAADVLLKSAGISPSGPVVLCGNGPLLLQSAVHLKALKIPIAGVALTGSPLNTLAALPHVCGALLRPLYLAKGMGMALSTLFSGAPVILGAKEPRIERDGDGFVVRCQGRGRQRSLAGKTVFLHEGVVSENRLTLLAGMRHVWNPVQRCRHAAADCWGQTSVPGIRAAGDCAGVRGADAATQLGRLAGLDMARELGLLNLKERDAKARPGLRRLCRLKAMQPFLDRLFAPRPEHLLPPDDALVCRCEELTAGELRTHIRAGSFSADGLKAQARPGMGPCQGRMCGPAVVEMIAQAVELPAESLGTYNPRPPLVPLRMGELAEMDLPPQWW